MVESEHESDSKPQEFRAKSLWEGGLRTNTLIRGFEVQSDDPVAEFGTNTAPAPAEIFLGSIGACLITTYAWRAFTSRLSLTAMTANVKGKIEKVDNVEKITSIEIKFKVSAITNKPDKLERCFQLTHENCLLLNSLDFEKKVDFEYTITDS
jgi:uncharacterized OsmC-like protein